MQESGFRLLHGIVDSLWLYKQNATKQQYQRLADIIELETGFSVSLDLYRWIVFLPSKEAGFVPVANRYFGCKDDGELKIRGIEARRHDTPEYFRKCQLEILDLFSKCDTIQQIKEKLGDAYLIKEKYKETLLRFEVPPEELAFTNRISKDAADFQSNTIQKDAAVQLKNEGKNIKAGQKISFVINDHTRKITKRVVPLDFIHANQYDAKKYCELLDECCDSILEPFEN